MSRYLAISMPQSAKFIIPLSLLATLAGCAFKNSNQGTSPPSDSEHGASRNMYSPDIYGDANARQRWSDAIQSLETQCRTTGEYCAEAQGARNSLRNGGDGVVRPAR